MESAQNTVAVDWSRDGRFLLYRSTDPETDRDLWVRPMAGDQEPWIFLQTPFTDTWARFSPDGRWVAYQSNESGRAEIYVRPFALRVSSGSTAIPTSGQWQVSTAGGIYPTWRADGRELYYLGPDGAMMAAPITVRDATLDPGRRCRCFRHGFLEAAWTTPRAGITT